MTRNQRMNIQRKIHKIVKKSDLGVDDYNQKLDVLTSIVSTAHTWTCNIPVNTNQLPLPLPTRQPMYRHH